MDTTGVAVNMFQCSICNNNLKTKAIANRHIKTSHSNKLKLECPLGCAYKASRQDTLRKHLDRHNVLTRKRQATPVPVCLSDNSLNDELNLQVGKMMLNLKDIANQGPCITPGGANNISTLNLDEVNSVLTMDRLGNCSLQPINPQGVDPIATTSNTNVSSPLFIPPTPLVSPSLSHPMNNVSHLAPAASFPNPSGELETTRKPSSSSDLTLGGDTSSCMDPVLQSLPTPSTNPSR